MAAIESPELVEGMEIITSSKVISEDDSESETKNPFMPNMPKPKRGSGSSPRR